MTRPGNGVLWSEVEPAAETDEASLETLYRRYAAWLTGALRRRFGAAITETADDLVQETYLRIAPYQTGGQVRHARALLLRVATNLAHDQLRRTARQGAAAAIEELDEKTEHASAAHQIEAVLLRQVILSLPRALRDVFVLSRFAGLTNQDIAKRYGLALKTVEWRMTRALAHIAEQLRD